MDEPLGQSKLEDYGFGRVERRVERDRKPIKSLCASCGRERWLNWIVAGKHLCDECAVKPKTKTAR